MDRLKHKTENSKIRRNRVRKAIKTANHKPRLNVSISNRHIRAQIIDDNKHHTLLAVSTDGDQTKGSMSDKASWVGEQIGQKAKKAKINKVVFDRSTKLYHGRVQLLAEAARKTGLEF